MIRTGPEVIKLFFMLNSVEYEILNAYKYKNYTIVGILTFMSRKKH